MLKTLLRKLDHFISNNNAKLKYLKVQKLNRHMRRSIGAQNKIGIIPKKE